MVNIKINLLKNRPALSEREYQREHNVLRWSLVALVMIVLGVVALSLWKVVLVRNLTEVETEMAAASRDIQGLVQANASQIYLKSRLKLITAYLTERTVIRESLQKVLANDVAGTHVDGASFIEDNLLRIQVAAGTNEALEEALKYYQASGASFVQVVSRGITRSRDGQYQLTLDLTLPVGAKKNVD